MSEFIVDISANTHKNDFEYLKTMLDTLKSIDKKKHHIIIKHQLFEKAGENIPLEHDIFVRAYYYAKKLGYLTTSSVFDKKSLDFLLSFDIPFIKISNNRSNDWLIRKIPREIPVYISHSDNKPPFEHNVRHMCCISKYPCCMQDYLEVHKDRDLSFAISDHTTDWMLFKAYEPDIYECHYVLEHDENNLDGGLFARTPDLLKQVL